MSEGAKPEPRFKIGDRVISAKDGPAIVTQIIEPVPLWQWAGGWTAVVYHIRPELGRYDVPILESDLRPADVPDPPATS